jgi:hypothetical protein
MLHRQSLQIETYDRGPLLEELRRLSLPRYTLGVLRETPADKPDVKQHQEYLQAIKDPMDALLEKVDEYYNMDEVKGFVDIKNSFHEANEKNENNLWWYTDKEKNVEYELKIIEEILNTLEEANEAVTEYQSLWRHTNDNDIKTAVQACYPPLHAYKAYLQKFVHKK